MSDDHVLIVGGNSGIGLALAQQVIDQDGKVTIASRSEERLESACGEIERDMLLG